MTGPSVVPHPAETCVLGLVAWFAVGFVVTALGISAAVWLYRFKGAQ